MNILYMRGKKSYNIKNIEAHLGHLDNKRLELPIQSKPVPFALMPIGNNNILTKEQQLNEYVNAKYGVSKYASNLVSGKMFKNVF